MHIMSPSIYDVLIIGSGSSGYTAALRTKDFYVTFLLHTLIVPFSIA